MSTSISFVRYSLVIRRSGTGSTVTLEEGTDYTWTYSDHKLVITILKTGQYTYTITYNAEVSRNPNLANEVGDIPF